MNPSDKDTIYYLEKAPVPKAIAHMAIPMILGMIVNVIYNIIDAYFIGRLNNTAMLAAVTLALPLMSIQMGVGQIFGVGGSTYIARLLGEKNKPGAQRTSSVNFYLSMIAGVVVMAACLPLLPLLLKVLGAAGETLQYTRDFTIALLLGSPFIIANTSLSETVRAEGASTQSMVGMIISVAVNIILDPIFIFVFRMNVTGAALATVAGNICAFAYYVWYLHAKSEMQSVSFKDCRPNREILSAIFKVGSSAFLLSGFMILSFLVFNNYAMLYGDTIVAAFGVANRVVQLIEFISMGLYMGIVPLIAFAYSAGDRKRLNQVLKTTVLLLAAITLALSAVLYLFRLPVLGLFSSDESFIQIGIRVLIAMLVSTLFSGFGGLFMSMFQAFGKGAQSNILSIIKGVILIPAIFLGNLLWGLNGIIWSLPVSELITGIMGLLLWMASRRRIMATEPPAPQDAAAECI